MSTQQETNPPAPAEAINKHNITVKSEFVPFSKSRNAKGKNLSLNWVVTLQKNGRDIVTTKYSAGVAHCPAYKNAKGIKTSLHNDERIRAECESGFEYSDVRFAVNKTKPLLPKTEDVVYSLLQDSEVIDYANFEDWAVNAGFDPDSRKAEAIYRDCLEIGLRLRSWLGDDVLSELREAFANY